MRIGGIQGLAIGPASRRASAQRHQPDTQVRALIALAPAAPSERIPLLTRHPAAPFLAQLIATRLQAPQTRARRRVEPEDAIAVYAAAMAPRQAFPARRAGRCRSVLLYGLDGPGGTTGRLPSLASLTLCLNTFLALGDQILADSRKLNRLAAYWFPMRRATHVNLI